MTTEADLKLINPTLPKQSGTARVYYDEDNNPRPLFWMVRNRPGWTETRFTWMENRIKELELLAPRAGDSEGGEAERLREVIKNCQTAFDILEAAPEINPSNYDHDQVCELNAKVTEAYLIMKSALYPTDPNLVRAIQEQTE